MRVAIYRECLCLAPQSVGVVGIDGQRIFGTVETLVEFVHEHVYEAHCIPVAIGEWILVKQVFQHFYRLVIFASAAVDSRYEFEPLLVVFVSHFVEPFLGLFHIIIVHIQRPDVEHEVVPFLGWHFFVGCFDIHFGRGDVGSCNRQFHTEVEIVDIALVVDGLVLPAGFAVIAHGEGLTRLEYVRTDSPGI